MHNTGVKPQLRKCYRNIFIFIFMLRLHSVILNYNYFVYNRVDKLLIFFSNSNSTVVCFSKMQTFARGGGTSANMYEQGWGSKKGQFYTNGIIEWPHGIFLFDIICLTISLLNFYRTYYKTNINWFTLLLVPGQYIKQTKTFKFPSSSSSPFYCCNPS